MNARFHKGHRFSPLEKAKAILPLVHSARDGRESLVESIAAELGISSRSVWRWYHAFMGAGTRALAPERRDRGSSRFFLNNPGAALFVVCRFACGVTSASALLGEMQAQLAGPLPSLKTLTTYLRSLKGSALRSPEPTSPEPHAPADPLWLTVEQAIQLTGWSYRTLRRKAHEERIETRLSTRRGRNGKCPRQYAVHSLRAEARK